MRRPARRRLLSLWPALAALLACAPLPASAVTVAVLDTGVDYNDPALAGHIADGGRDFHDNDLDPIDEDPDRHGTLVSRVILGVSGSSLILPVRVLGADGEGSNLDISRALAYTAQTSARVINLSFGDTDDTFDPLVGAALQAAARANKVIVMAAGNQGRDQPTFPANLADELAGNAIAVGATDAPGVIASYSNRAGASMQYFLVAPGNDPVTGAVGTSFAAPRVAGAAAEVLGQNPSLSSTQVVEILLDSADDRGAPGTDEIYGRGELNLTRALQARGVVSVPSAASGGGSSIGAGALVVAAGAAAALALRSRSLPDTLVLDSYGRPYALDLGALIEPADHRPGLAALLRGDARDLGYLAVDAGRSTRLSVWYTPAAAEMPRPDSLWRDDPADSTRPANWAAAVNAAPGAGWELAASFNTDPRMAFGALRVDGPEVPLATGLAGAAPGSSFLGFAPTGQSARVAWQPAPDTQLVLGYAHMAEDESVPHGLRSETLVAEARTRPAADLTLALTLSELTEQGSLLGGSAGGPLGVERASTVAGGLSAHWQLDESLALTANYAVGLTRVDPAADSLLDAVSPLASQTYGLGIVAANVLGSGDRLGVAVSRPLRIVRGRAHLSVPIARAANGAVWFQGEDVALDAPGAELDIEASYHRPLGRRGAMSAYLLYRDQPDHDPAAAATLTALAAVRWGF